VSRDPTVLRWYDLLHKSPEGAMQATAELIEAKAKGTLPPEILNPKAAADMLRKDWLTHIAAVERYNEPGKFTAFIGFEYTLMDEGRNLHRNVVFRDSGNKASTVLPLASFGTTVPDGLWDELPREVQERIIELGLKVYTVDAFDVAHRAGMGGRINTVMQTCFFALAKIFPREEAIGYIKRQIKKTYGAKGEDVVSRNYAVVDDSLAHLHEIMVPATASSRIELPPIVSGRAPDFVKRVTAVILAGKGDSLPVSAFPIDGTWPTATSKWEKRNLALEIPVWDPLICTQCNKCAMVCPHAAIRVKVYPAAALEGAPATFKSTEFKATYCQGDSYSVQVAPED